MKNQEIARLLETLADVLEIKGENPFKIRAYRRASMTLSNLSEDIEKYWREGKLFSLPGIGEGIAKKIAQYLETGKIEKLEEEKKGVPDSLIEMLQIPGLGPKSIAILWKQKGITTIEQLEEACKKGILVGLPGFGQKKVEKILEGIKLYKERKTHATRHLLGHVFPIVQSLVKYIKEKTGVEKVEAAGSFRRMKATIGDIDILAASTEPAPLMDAFVSSPDVEKVLWKGEQKTSVILLGGIQADLRVIHPSSWGAALQYFTGSKNHNIHLREIAKKRNWKISEYGVFDLSAGEKKIAGETEEEVYEILGLQFIPPELREDRGEIEAAASRKIPRLVEYSDIKGDMHVHSKWSDGANTIEEIARACIEMGFEYVAIADHSRSLKVARGVEIEDLKAKLKEIESLNKKFDNFRILSAAEVDILPDGSLDYPDEVLAMLDFVVAAVHTKFNMTEEEMTKRIIKAMQNKYVHAIAHPTGRLLLKREPYPVNISEILKVAADTGTLLELNAYQERLDLEDVHLKAGKELGVKFVIGTDAHQIGQLWMIKLGVGMARRGWLEPEDVINTYEFDRLIKSLRQKRG